MPGDKIDEQGVLNFALNLEYLAAEFYTCAVTVKSITSFGIGAKGRVKDPNPTGGHTARGKQITSSDNFLHAAEIGANERAPVVLLRGALGSAALATPNIDLSALGFGFDNQNDFLRVARILEEVGVTATREQPVFLKTPDIITAAAGLLGAETEHAAGIRTQIARLQIATTALDGADRVPPPSGPARQSWNSYVSRL